MQGSVGEKPLNMFMWYETHQGCGMCSSDLIMRKFNNYFLVHCYMYTVGCSGVDTFFSFFLLQLIRVVQETPHAWARSLVM